MSKYIMPYTLFALVFLTYFICIYLILKEPSMLSKKDCMIAEISPDFSQKEKELCRELRGKK